VESNHGRARSEALDLASALVLFMVRVDKGQVKRSPILKQRPKMMAAGIEPCEFDGFSCVGTEESDKRGLFDLPIRRPGHGVDDFDGLWDHEWLKPLAACRAKNGGRYLAAVVHYYEGVDGLTENLVRPANYCGVKHTGRRSQRGLDLGGSDLLPA
jgi:hypothetical protein